MKRSRQKISKLALATVISVGMILPSVPANADNINHIHKKQETNFVKIPKTVSKKLRENSNMKFLVQNQNQDLQIEMGQVQRVITNNQKVITPSTTVTYIFPLKFSSKTNSIYKVSDFKIIANPNMKYDDAEVNSENKKIVDEINKSIKVETGNVTGLTSMSTFSTSISINIGKADSYMTFFPNLEMEYSVDGKEYTQKIKEEPIKTSNEYVATLNTNMKIQGRQGNIESIGVSISPSYPDNEGVGYYNPQNQKLKSISFKINQQNLLGGSGKIKIIPKLNKDFTYNKVTGVYTVTEPYINGSYNNLFDIELPKEGVVDENLYVTPVNMICDKIGNPGRNTWVKLRPIPLQIEQIKGGGGGPGFPVDIKQEIIPDYNYYYPQEWFDTQIGKGLIGDYDIYVGSVFTNAMAVAMRGQTNLILSNETYVHLNKKDFNTMINGTASEKAALMKNVVEGRLNSGEKAYTSQDVQNMINRKSKTPIMDPNYVFVKGDYTGNKETISGTYQFITNTTKYGVPGNSLSVMTLGVLKSNLNEKQNEDLRSQLMGQMSQGNDTVFVRTKNKSGINNNADTVLSSGNKVSGFFLGNTGGSVYRFNKISTDSQGFLMAYAAYMRTYIDGQSPATINESQEWMAKTHNVQIEPTTINWEFNQYFTKGSQFKIDLGSNFKLESPVTYGGETLSPSDYIIKDGVMTVTLNKNMPFTSKIDFKMKYDKVPDYKVIKVMTTFNINKTLGVVDELNNQDYPEAKTGGIGFGYYGPQITVVNCNVNNCESIAEAPDKDNNVQVINAIANSKKVTKTYYMVGELPEANGGTLANNLGGAQKGGLSGSFINGTLDGGDAPVYVLPASALNHGENKEIVSGSNGNDLKGKLTYVENPANGWVKYKKGMNLKGMIAYFANPTLKPGGTYTVKYKMHLNGVDSGINGQETSSAFKYYDSNIGVGTNSNINIIEPFVENKNNRWESNVSYTVGGKNVSLSAADLNKTVTVDGKSYKLQDLIGSGLNNDGQNDIIPKLASDDLLSKLQMASNSNVLTKLGYKLDSIKVNGNVITNLNYFETRQGIVNDKGLTKIEFTISPYVGSVTIKVIDSVTNKPLNGATVTVNGKKYIVKNGEIQVNNLNPGSITATGTDKNYTSGKISVKVTSNTDTVGTIALNPNPGKDTIKVVDGVTGKVLPNSKVKIGGKTYTTNKNGEVTVPANESKDGKAESGTVSKENYANGTVSIPTSAPGENINKTVVLNPNPGKDTIKVVDGVTGKVLPNSKVKIGGKTYTTNKNGEVTVSANESKDGKAENGTVSKENYSNGTVSIPTSAPGENINKTVVLNPNPGKDTIKVVDGVTGKVLPNSKVEIGGKTYTTNKKGMVTVPANESKDGKAESGTVSKENYANGTVSIPTSAPGENINKTVVLNPNPGKDTIKVIDGVTGKILSGAKINIGGKTYTTDKKGMVTVPANESKDGKAESGTVSKENYANGTVSIPTSAPGENINKTVVLNPNPGKDTIKVVDGVTGKVLPNSKVEIGGKTYTTNKNGIVTVPANESKDGKAERGTVSKENYANGTVSIPTSAPGENINKTVVLNPNPGKDTIKVVDGVTGKVLPNSKVKIGGKTYTTNKNGEVTVSANESKDGKAENGTVSKENYSNGTVSIPTSAPGENINKTVVLNPNSGKDTIKVVDGVTGKILSGAKINIGGKTYTTNKNGIVTVPANESKDGKAESGTVSKENYANGTVSIPTSAPGENINKTVVLNPNPGKDTIKVVDGVTGKILSGAKINIGGKTYTTDKSGEVTVPANESKDGKAESGTVSKENYSNGTVSIPTSAPGENINKTVVLNPNPGKDTIKVVDGVTGKVLPNSKVEIGGKTYTTDKKGMVTVPANESKDGKAESGTVSKENYSNGTVSIPTSAPGENINKTVVLNPNPGKDTIKVVDGVTGKVLPNSKVEIGGKTYTTDKKGMVTVPANESKDGKAESGTVSKENYANGTVSIPTSAPGENINKTVVLNPNPGKDTIKVVDGVTGKVLPNSKVDIGGKTYTTNKNGEVTVPANESKDGKAESGTVSKENYANGTVSIPTSAPGENINKTVVLNPNPGKDTIKVIDGVTGKILSGAKINIDGKTYTTDKKGMVTVPANESKDGKAESGTVSKENYANGTVSIRTSAPGENINKTVVLNPNPGKDTIKVVDGVTGKVLPNSKVEIGGKTYTTNKNGIVTVPANESKDGKAENGTVSKENYANGTVSIPTSAPGENINKTVVLNPNPGKDTIKVVDGVTGKILSGAKINIGGKTYTTDKKGMVTVPANESKDGKAESGTVSKENYANGTVSIPTSAPGENINKTVVLNPNPGKDTIKVVDGVTGKVLPNSKVEIGGKTYTTNKNGEVTVPANESKDGKAESGTVSKENYANGTVSIPTSAPGENINKTVVLNPNPGKDTIKIVDGVTGNPVPGATVNIDGKTYVANSNGIVTVPANESKDGNPERGTVTSKNYRNGTVTVPTINPGENIHQVVVINPDPGTDTIKVINGDTGKPVPGATVNIDGKTYTTNSNGEVTIPANETKDGKPLEGIVEKDGHKIMEISVPTNEPGEKLSLTVKMFNHKNNEQAKGITNSNFESGNPKTGDSSEAPIAATGVVATMLLAANTLLKRKRKTQK